MGRTYAPLPRGGTYHYANNVQRDSGRRAAVTGGARGRARVRARGLVRRGQGGRRAIRPRSTPRQSGDRFVGAVVQLRCRFSTRESAVHDSRTPRPCEPRSGAVLAHTHHTRPSPGEASHRQAGPLGASRRGMVE